MKVAHICPYLRFFGGTEKFVAEVNSEMRAMGIDSRIYSLDFNPKPALLSTLALSRLLAARAIKDGFDSLIFHKGQAGSRRIRNVRTICYFHQIFFDDLVGEGLVRRVYRDLLVAVNRKLSQVVCNSEYAASRFHSLIPGASVKVVYPGVRTPTNDEHRILNQDFCYYHSRINPRKNQLFLTKVFEKLPYKLLLTGGTWDRQFRKYQAKVCQEISGISNIKIDTNISNASYRRFLVHSILFCFPALNEPFGMVMLEAMAYGKPIIALESGATKEVLGDAGILCKHDISRWRDAISELVSNPGLQSSLSKKGAKRASNFSWQKTAKQLVDIIDAS